MPTKPTGRPRGRPKGSKNVPKIEDFVAESLRAPVPVPELKPKGAIRGPWAKMTPEQRSEHARKLSLARKTHGGGHVLGVPNGITVAAFEARKAAQQPIIDRIMKKMADNGQLPDDPRAVEALRETVAILRTQEDAKLKLSAARLILDFTKSKPTAKVEHTIKSAEDILDEMAKDE